MKKRVKPEGSGRKKGSGVKYKRTFSIDVELKDFKVKSKVVNQLLWNEYLMQKTINIKFEDIEIGQHLWVISAGELIMVAKFDNDGYQVCGDWECGINHNHCQIIELVNVPKGYENVKLAYLNG